MGHVEPSVQDYANHNVIVTTKEEVDGQPTLPLSFALSMADHMAEHEDTDG